MPKRLTAKGRCLTIDPKTNRLTQTKISNHMASEFLLFTLIPPATSRMQNGKDEGAAYQRACVDSWIAAGFSVVSVNSNEEASTVRSLGLPIEVASIGSAGRPVISDILALASASGARLSGIVNSDCMFIGSVPITSTLAPRAKYSLFLCERTDIHTDTALPVPGHCAGFDGFFFDPSNVEGNSDRYFRLGDTW